MYERIRSFIQFIESMYNTYVQAHTNMYHMLVCVLIKYYYADHKKLSKIRNSAATNSMRLQIVRGETESY